MARCTCMGANDLGAPDVDPDCPVHKTINEMHKTGGVSHVPVDSRGKEVKPPESKPSKEPQELEEEVGAVLSKDRVFVDLHHVMRGRGYLSSGSKTNVKKEITALIRKRERAARKDGYKLSLAHMNRELTGHRDTFTRNKMAKLTGLLERDEIPELDRLSKLEEDE